MRRTKHRLKSADQRLIGEQRIEIHGNFRHPDAMPFGRNRRMQVGQGLLVVEPAALRHEAFDELQDAVGPPLQVGQALEYRAPFAAQALVALAQLHGVLAGL